MFYTWKVCFVIEPLCSDQYSNVEATPMNKLNFHFQPNIEVETTLIYWRLINVILSMLFQCCFINVETTLINICWLNFHFKPNVNVETTLFYRRSMDVILSTLSQRCSANVETTSINVRRLNFHFQPNINVETTLTNRSINNDVFAGDIDISILAVAMLKVMCILKKHMIFA